MLEPQVLAGKAKRGDVINLPDGGYAAVQISQSFLAGATETQPRTENAILTLLQKYFKTLLISIPFLPHAQGSPPPLDYPFT